MRKFIRIALFLSECAIIPACSHNQISGPIWVGTPSAVSGTGGTAMTAVLDWSAAIDNSGTGITYSIFQGTGGPGTEDMTTAVATTTLLTTTLTGLTVNSTYWFVIRATDGNGHSAGSPEFQVTETP
jgi:hypothetical protein